MDWGLKYFDLHKKINQFEITIEKQLALITLGKKQNFIIYLKKRDFLLIIYN